MSPKFTVGCQLRCRPRHLTVVLNYEALLAVLKLLTEARNRQPETFIPTYPISTLGFRLNPLYLVLIVNFERGSPRCCSK